MIQQIKAKLHPYKFKSIYNLEQRSGIYTRLQKSDSLPKNHNPKDFLFIVVEPSTQFVESAQLDTSKKLYKTFIIRKQLKSQQLATNIKNMIKLHSKQSLHLFSMGRILTPDLQLGDLASGREDDGFVYIQYGISESF